MSRADPTMGGDGWTPGPGQGDDEESGTSLDGRPRGVKSRR